MSSRMDVKDLEIMAREGQQKFEYAMVSVTLAALALSFQFSPGHGTKEPYLLIAGWILLFISVILGGWRLMFAPAAMMLNVKLIAKDNQSQALKQRLRDSQELGLNPNILNPNTLSPMSEDLVLESVATVDAHVKQGWKRLDRLGRWAPRIYNLQVLLIILGLGCIGAFSTINFLEKARV